MADPSTVHHLQDKPQSAEPTKVTMPYYLVSLLELDHGVLQLVLCASIQFTTGFHLHNLAYTAAFYKAAAILTMAVAILTVAVAHLAMAAAI